MVIVKSNTFVEDVIKVKDANLELAITQRLARVAGGNFGDTKSVGGGVSEMRIHYGAGYRLYYTVRGQEIIFMLCAGAKSNQSRDIERAKQIKQEV